MFLPGAMVGLILAGVDPADAVKVQVSVMYLVLGSVATTTAVMSLGISRELFTPAQQLRREREAHRVRPPRRARHRPAVTGPRDCAATEGAGMYPGGVNGAESLLRTLVASGVEVCFANPGTSEMHFVAALDRVDGMRPVLGLFEGVVTGMADGYARMAERPAATLLHLGPGLANGLANLHNARRAASPIVNIVGDHATYHAQYDAPLASDIVGFARPVSGWVARLDRAPDRWQPTAPARCRRPARRPARSPR